MGEVTWSVHHSVRASDRAGLGTNKNFRYITNEELSRYVSFELGKITSVGRWGSFGLVTAVSRWEASFSAQSAALHSIWGSYRGRHAFKCLGALNVSPEGYVFWTGRWKIALCRFRDNILMASDADPVDCKKVVALVKSVLEKVWKLPVECLSADNQGLCQGRRMGPVIRCMGFCIAMGEG